MRIPPPPPDGKRVLEYAHFNPAYIFFIETLAKCVLNVLK